MPPVQPDKKERARINRRARRSKIRQNASNTIPTPGPSGGGAVPNVTAAPRRNNNGGGGGGNGGGGNGTGNVSNPAAPLDDIPKQHTNSPIWDTVDPGLYGQFFNDPGVAATKWMGANGIDSNRSGGAAAIFDDLAQFAPALWELTQGGNGASTDLTYAQYLDFVDSFLKDYSTSVSEGGGGQYDPRAMMQNLFGAGPQAGSGLDKILNNPSLDPGQQRDVLLGMVNAGLGSTMPGNLVSAIMAGIDNDAKSWQANFDLDDPQALLDYLKTKPSVSSLF